MRPQGLCLAVSHSTDLGKCGCHLRPTRSSSFRQGRRLGIYQRFERPARNVQVSTLPCTLAEFFEKERMRVTASAFVSGSVPNSLQSMTIALFNYSLALMAWFTLAKISNSSIFFVIVHSMPPVPLCTSPSASDMKSVRKDVDAARRYSEPVLRRVGAKHMNDTENLMHDLKARCRIRVIEVAD